METHERDHKFIGRLLRMFSTQIWEKVDCNMKSRFLVNIWNMHAWLIASDIYNEMSALSARALHILTHSAFPLTHRASLARRTHNIRGEGPCGSWWYCISDFVCNGKKFSNPETLIV